MEKAEVKARRDAQRILDEARETADGVYAELDEMRRHINDEQETEEINRARTELRRRLNEHEARLRSPEETLPQEEKKSARPLRAGDTVQIKTMGVRAQVLSVSKDGTVSLKAGIMTVTAKEDREEPLSRVIRRLLYHLRSGCQRHLSVPEPVRTGQRHRAGR